SGMALRQVLDPVGVELRWITPVVPVLGTIGLILIVLEGALDLAVTRERIRLIAVSATSALTGFGVTLAVMATLFVTAFDLATAIFFFLNRSDGHVRFLPLIAGIVFLYAAGKALHLSPLVLVLGCGLLLNNPHLANWSRRLSAWRGDNYDQRLKEFKGLVAE